MKVTDSKGVQSTSKKKKTSSTGKASGVSFDAMVDKASGIQNVEGVEGAAGVDSVGGVDADASGASSYVPTDAKGRGAYMLDALEQLERDILAGHDTSALERLKDALATKAEDVDQLPPKLKEILDEIETRVAIEVAKMEESE